MELSDLCQYKGKLLTGDDRTGIIYSVRPGDHEGAHHLKVCCTLAGGQPDAPTADAFKIEWMTEYDDKLYVGSHGREGKPGTMFEVKVCEDDGDGLKWVQTLDWKHNYLKLYEARNIKYPPGYQAYEGVEYHDGAWWFLPRKEHTSDDPHEKFDYTLYQNATGSNAVIKCDSDISESLNVKKCKTIGELNKAIGVSSFTFLRDNLAAVVRTLETDQNKLCSYLWIVDLKSGKEFPLANNVIADNEKIEGVTCIRSHGQAKKTPWKEFKAASKSNFSIDDD